MRIAITITLSALMAAAGASAATPGKALSKNLLANPGAEAGPTTPDSATAPAALPGWTTTGGFHAVGYNGYRWAPAPGDRTKGSGSKLFVGCLAPPGQTVNVGTATQEVSLARWAKAIDRNELAVSLSAELGGYDGTINRAVGQLVFLGDAGTPVGRKVRLVGPTYIQRQGVTRVEKRTATAPIPVRARRARVTLTGSRAGTGPCGFLDNISLTVERKARP